MFKLLHNFRRVQTEQDATPPETSTWLSISFWTLAVSRASVRDALLQRTCIYIPPTLSCLLLSHSHQSPPLRGSSPQLVRLSKRSRLTRPAFGHAHTQDLIALNAHHNKNKEESLLVRAVASLEETNQHTRSLPSCLIYIGGVWLAQPAIAPSLCGYTDEHSLIVR